MGGFNKSGVTRRDLFKFGGIAAAGVMGASALSACSPNESTATAGTATAANEGTTTAAGHTRTGLPSFLQAPEPITDIAETKEFDVVVVGAGAAGVPAALSAAEAGAKVALIQKEATAISQGNTGSGIDLTKSDPADVQNLVSVLIEEGQHRTKRELLELWAQHGGEAVKWVIERSAESGGPIIDQGSQQQAATIAKNGWTMEFVTSFAGPKPLTAGDAMRALAETAEKEGVEIFYSTPAEQLVKDGDAVTGVIAKGSNGYIQFNASKGVIIATGDYQNDEEMSSYYLPDLANFTRKQMNKTGDGHKMVIWAGGAMEPINHTKMLHDFDAGPASMCDMPFLAVKNNGARFVNEVVEMSLLNNYLRSAEDQGWYSQVFDANYMEQAADWPGKLYSPEELALYMPEEDADRDGVFKDLIRTFKADTLEELAEKLEITDTAAFVATVERYNELVASGADEDFGKPSQYLKPIDTPPYYGIHRWLRVSALCSGVQVDENHQCLNTEGSPIAGLYAIGNCSGEFYGGVDYPMTIPGLSLGRCYTEGYLVGRTVGAL
ncbi:FAD-dependent oxidoreductase [Raoultibacter timonensis]|uniref:FAD-dependent oxidoreductase n=1 Tax=Raoultibacter timonensis TaxID=1907662 RepID=UPI0026DD72E9|nr:FAD-dependent oxidoreductase [Raoultibacter timonensis]